MRPSRTTLAGVAGLLALASLTVVVPWARLLDGPTRARRAWWVDVLGEGRRPVGWLGLFSDARGAPVTSALVLHQGDEHSALGRGTARMPEPVHVAPHPPLGPDRAVLTYEGWERPDARSASLVAYATPPGVPPDPWGGAWLLVLDRLERRGGHYRLTSTYDVWSAGPDGRFEFGGGDDVQVGPLHPRSFELRGGVRRPWGPHGVPWDTEPAFLVTALLAAWAWVTVHTWRAPRSDRPLPEVARATVVAALPCAIAFAVATDLRLERVVPVADDLLVVRPRTAVGLSAVALVWGVVLWWRLRRPQPSEP